MAMSQPRLSVDFPAIPRATAVRVGRWFAGDDVDETTALLAAWLMGHVAREVVPTDSTLHRLMTNRAMLNITRARLVRLLERIERVSEMVRGPIRNNVARREARLERELSDLAVSRRYGLPRSRAVPAYLQRGAWRPQLYVEDGELRWSCHVTDGDRPIAPDDPDIDEIVPGDLYVALVTNLHPMHDPDRAWRAAQGAGRALLRGDEPGGDYLEGDTHGA